MLYSKLLDSSFRKHDDCRLVKAICPPPTDTLSNTLVLKDVSIHPSVLPLFENEEEKWPTHVRFKLFSAADELKRLPRRHPVLSRREIRRALYVRGTFVPLRQILSAALHANHLFGQRLILFLLHRQIEIDGVLISSLAWRRKGTKEEIIGVPSHYLFTSDTWIAFR